MSLTTFFKVATGQYSDEQIRAAAAAYYSRTAAAAVAAVNNDITVNVNIDGETVKQFKPEQGTKPEKKPDQPKQPKTEQSEQQEKPESEKKPESTKATPPKQPKQQEKPEQPAKPEPEQPAKKPKQPKTEQSEQQEKPEPEQPAKKPKQPEKQSEPPVKKSEQQDVAAQQAAHPLSGFNIAAFTQSTPQQMAAAAPVSTPTQPAPIQQSMPVMPVVPVYPANYRELTPEQRCDHLVGVINRGLLPPMHNPRPDLSIEQKVAELKKHITFMDMPGRQIGQVRIDSILTMISSQSLKNAMNKNDAVDRANNPKLSEVPVSKYATGDQISRFDMCFEAKLKDPKKILVVLYSTVPSFDPIQNTWSGDSVIFVKEI